MKRLITIAMLVFGMNALAQESLDQIVENNSLEYVSKVEGIVTLSKTFNVEVDMYFQKATYVFEAIYVYNNGEIKMMSLENTGYPEGMQTLQIETYRGVMKEGIKKDKWEEIISKAKDYSTLR